MKMQSIWMEGIRLPRFPKLDSDKTTEVLIVGGGLAGILCAYELSKRGVSYLLCEGATIGSGTTGSTTGVLSAQHDTFYSDMIEEQGEENAKLYLEANLAALEKYRILSQIYNFDFEEKASFIYSETDPSFLEYEAKSVNMLGFPATFETKISLPLPLASAVSFPNQAQMHPLKLLSEISKDLYIYERSLIERIKDNIAYCGDYKIKANKIIVTSHFPIINTHGLYSAKLYQKRSYVIALENAQDINGTFVENKPNGLYFRNYKNYLIIGGGDHRTGKKGEAFNAPRAFAKKYYPNATERYSWATQDCMSLDGIPYIGVYSAGLPNVFVATGFNEWGMTTSMVASEILCDMVLGVENKYAKVFSPSRNPLKAQLFSNLGTTILNFITPTTKRCPHLGCALKWNALEHSWDCPCHGSRFNENGKLLNNPATGSIRKK